MSRLELRDRGLDRTLDGAIVGVLQLAPLADRAVVVASWVVRVSVKFHKLMVVSRHTESLTRNIIPFIPEV